MLRQMFIVVLTLYMISGCHRSRLVVTKQAGAETPSSYSEGMVLPNSGLGNAGDAEKQHTPAKKKDRAAIEAACEKLAQAYRIQKEAAVKYAESCEDCSDGSRYESEDSGIFVAVLPPVFRDELEMEKWRVGLPVEGQNGCWALLPLHGLSSFELAYADDEGRIARREVSIPNWMPTNGKRKKWPTQLVLQDQDEDGHEEAFFISYEARHDRAAVVTPKNGELQDMLPFAQNQALYRRMASDDAFLDANDDGKIDVILEDTFKLVSTGGDDGSLGRMRIPMLWDGAGRFSLTHPDIRRVLDKRRPNAAEKGSLLDSPQSGSRIDSGDVMLLKTLGVCTADIRSEVRYSLNKIRPWLHSDLAKTKDVLSTYRQLARAAADYVPFFKIEPVCGFKEIKNNAAGRPADCYQGDLTVSSAADLKILNTITCINGTLAIKRIQFNKIVASVLKEIHGNVVISGNAELTDLLFPQLEFVEGDLSIFDNPKLGQLDSFNGLAKIGGGLYLENNPALRQIEGFEKIEWIGDDLVLADLPQLESLLFLKNLQRVGGDLHLAFNDSLKKIEPPQKLDSIEGALVVMGNDGLTDLTAFDAPETLGGIQLLDNPSMTRIGGLQRVTEISGDLIVRNMEKLSSIQSLRQLRRIGGRLSIWKNSMLDSLEPLGGVSKINGDIILAELPKLVTLDALSHVVSVGGGIALENNTALENVNGLRGVRGKVAYIYIVRNPRLETIEELLGITESKGGVQIDRCKQLTSLHGLEGLKYIPEGNVHLGFNDKLKDVSALGGLSTFTGYFWIEKNPALERLALPDPAGGVIKGIIIKSNENLTHIIGGEKLVTLQEGVNISSNRKLESIMCFKNLQRVGGSFYLEDNDALREIEPAQKLKSIGGALKVANNDSLTDLTAFGALETLGGFELFFNRSMTRIGGLQRVTEIDGDLSIRSMEKLSGIQSLLHLRRIGGKLTLRETPVLGSIAPLNGVSKINGDILLAKLPKLVTLDGFSNVVAVGGDITVFECDALENLVGFKLTKAIGGSLKMGRNKSLQTLDELQNVTTIEGGIELISNLALTNVNGLGGVRGKVAYITIVKNPRLETIEGLSGITESEGGLEIKDCAHLTSLHGLEGLKHIQKGDVTISRNRRLKDVSALRGLATLNGHFNIMDNPDLPQSALPSLMVGESK